MICLCGVVVLFGSFHYMRLVVLPVVWPVLRRATVEDFFDIRNVTRICVNVAFFYFFAHPAIGNQSFISNHCRILENAI